MPLLINRRVLAAKVETTIGTAESLSGSDGAFNAFDVQIQPTIPVTARMAQGSFNKLAGVAGSYTGKCTFKTDMGWAGTTTEPTWASVLFPACGWVASGSDPTIYYPKSEAPGSNVKTVTIGVYEDGLLYSIAGAVGTARIIGVTGEMARVEWEFTGVWQTPTDTALISPTYPTAAALKHVATSVTYNSVTAINHKTLTIDLGNEIVARESATAAGIHSFIIVDRHPKIMIDPESVLVATQNWHNLWVGGTEAAFSCTFDTPGNSALLVSAPKAQVVNRQEASRNKVQVDQIELVCNKNGATEDQELSFSFTASS
jgi:hypothetical protein